MQYRYTLPPADDSERVLNVLQCAESFLERWAEDGNPDPESRENFQARAADFDTVKALITAAPLLRDALWAAELDIRQCLATAGWTVERIDADPRIIRYRAALLSVGPAPATEERSAPGSYRVSWEIDVDAESPEEAARQARAAQHPDTTATVFQVIGPDGARSTIDLEEQPAPLYAQCDVCGQLLSEDTPKADSFDCGGTCRWCMAKAGDPDCEPTAAALRAIIQEALEAWKNEFDGTADDLHVSGADLVDWFAGWREKAKAVVFKSPQTEEPRT